MAGGVKEIFLGKGGVEEDEVNPQHRGTMTRVSCFFFKAVVHAVLLFRLETLVVTPRM